MKSLEIQASPVKGVQVIRRNPNEDRASSAVVERPSDRTFATEWIDEKQEGRIRLGIDRRISLSLSLRYFGVKCSPARQRNPSRHSERESTSTFAVFQRIDQANASRPTFIAAASVLWLRLSAKRSLASRLRSSDTCEPAGESHASFVVSSLTTFPRRRRRTVPWMLRKSNLNVSPPR